MTNMQSKYCELLNYIYKHYIPFLKEESPEAIQLFDPVDKKIIGFHYGETHMGGAFVIGGIHFNKPEITKCGIRILNSFLFHADEFQREIAYHWDFNNFALCVVYEYLKHEKKFPEFQNKIKEFILTQKDSPNRTINWLPMRLYVNNWKYKWTKNNKYLKIIKKIKKNIEKAQYQDGFFEDLLPKGTSFNFQYHIFTTALLGFLKIRDIEVGRINEAIHQSINIMDSQGDINYLGRGNNQIFAWGPALYLYSLLEDPTIYQKGFDYIYDKSLHMIENDNIIVNMFDGNEKVWWWDYHYCSVYTAHFIFWLILTSVENQKIYLEKTPNISVKDSGVHIYKGNYYIVVFDGRKHYLAESGKSIANISRNRMSYFKGAFGPYYKEYGHKYGFPFAILHNHIGLLKYYPMLNGLSHRIIYPKTISVSENYIVTYIILSYERIVNNAILNLPWFSKKQVPIVKDDIGNSIALYLVTMFKGPYGWLYLYQSRKITTGKIEIVLGAGQ